MLDYSRNFLLVEKIVTIKSFLICRIAILSKGPEITSNKMKNSYFFKAKLCLIELQYRWSQGIQSSSLFCLKSKK